MRTLSLSLLLIALGLVACGGASDMAEPPPAMEAAPATEAAPAMEAPGDLNGAVEGEGENENENENESASDDAAAPPPPNRRSTTGSRSATGRKTFVGGSKASPGPRGVKSKTDDGLPLEAGFEEGAIAPTKSLPPGAATDSNGELKTLAAGAEVEAAQPEATPTQPAALDIDAFVDSLPEEAIVFNVPEEVLLDSVTQLRLIIQPGSEGAELTASFEEGRGELQTGELTTEAVKSSDEMGASLVSSGLDVTAMRPERQLLSRREPTEWLWEIRAKEGGRHVLTLTLYAIPPGRSSGRTLRVLEREMQVYVPPATQAVAMFQEHWEWMWTFLLAPLGGWWLTRKRRREEEPAAD